MYASFYLKGPFRLNIVLYLSLLIDESCKEKLVIECHKTEHDQLQSLKIQQLSDRNRSGFVLLLNDPQ